MKWRLASRPILYDHRHGSSFLKVEAGQYPMLHNDCQQRLGVDRVNLWAVIERNQNRPVVRVWRGLCYFRRFVFTLPENVSNLAPLNRMHFTSRNASVVVFESLDV